MAENRGEHEAGRLNRSFICPLFLSGFTTLVLSSNTDAISYCNHVWSYILVVTLLDVANFCSLVVLESLESDAERSRSDPAPAPAPTPTLSISLGLNSDPSSALNAPLAPDEGRARAARQREWARVRALLVGFPLFAVVGLIWGMVIFVHRTDECMKEYNSSMVIAFLLTWTFSGHGAGWYLGNL